VLLDAFQSDGTVHDVPEMIKICVTSGSRGCWAAGFRRRADGVRAGQGKRLGVPKRRGIDAFVFAHSNRPG
jgi:hypothetical protein